MYQLIHKLWTNIILFLLGICLIFIASIAEEKNWDKGNIIFLRSLSGILIGVSITNTVNELKGTSFLGELEKKDKVFFDNLSDFLKNIDSKYINDLSKFKTELSYFRLARISASRDGEVQDLRDRCNDKIVQGILKITLYRYYKTRHFESGEWIWYGREVELMLSADEKRWYTDYQILKKDKKNYMYTLSAAPFHKHLVLFLEPLGSHDVPTIEVYPFYFDGTRRDYSGISVRRSFPPDETKLTSPCLLCEKPIENINTKNNDGDLWEFSSPHDQSILQETWIRASQGMEIDNFKSNNS